MKRATTSPPTKINKNMCLNPLNPCTDHKKQATNCVVPDPPQHRFLHHEDISVDSIGWNEWTCQKVAATMINHIPFPSLQKMLSDMLMVLGATFDIGVWEITVGEDACRMVWKFGCRVTPLQTTSKLNQGFGLFILILCWHLFHSSLSQKTQTPSSPQQGKHLQSLKTFANPSSSSFPDTYAAARMASLSLLSWWRPNGANSVYFQRPGAGCSVIGGWGREELWVTMQKSLSLSLQRRCGDRHCWFMPLR